MCSPALDVCSAGNCRRVCQVLSALPSPCCSYLVISHPLGRPWHEGFRAEQPQLVPNELPQVHTAGWHDQGLLTVPYLSRGFASVLAQRQMLRLVAECALGVSHAPPAKAA